MENCAYHSKNNGSSLSHRDICPGCTPHQRKKRGLHFVEIDRPGKIGCGLTGTWGAIASCATGRAGCRDWHISVVSRSAVASLGGGAGHRRGERAVLHCHAQRILLVRWILAWHAGQARGNVTCRTCNSSHTITRVALPFVLKYLVTELAAMNIKVTFDLKPS